MKLFKNHQSKRKLKERINEMETENRMLKTIPVANVSTVERNIQKIAASTIIFHKEMELLPVDIIKRRVKRVLVDYLEPFIEWDYSDTLTGSVYSGTLYVPTGKKSE
mgnify:CR=1 FL=1